MRSWSKCIPLLISLISFSLFSHAVNAQNNALDHLKYEVNEAFIFNLKHTITITNQSPTRVLGRLVVPIIKNATARCYVNLYNIFPPEKKPSIIEDDSGNIYAQWNNILINAGQTFTAELQYYILSFSVTYQINPQLVKSYNESSNLYIKYTQQEDLIESNHPEIISKAAEITNNVENIHEKVSRIYNFVISHLRYVAQNTERGALWALRNKVGDCSEYSYLFVALCRAAGIPARIQAGFVFHSSREVTSNGHMWAEYYLEDYGWIPVDPTWRLFDAMDCRHFSSIQSIPKFTPYANYVFNYTVGFGLIDAQNVMLLESSPSIFTEKSLVIDIYKAVQKINEAKFALLLAQIFGASMIFPQEVTEIEEYIKRSQINLQGAIESLVAHPQFAQTDAAEAIRNAEKALQNAWMAVAEIFIIAIGALTILMIVCLFFIRRMEKRVSR